MPASVFHDVWNRSYGNHSNLLCDKVVKATKNSLGFVQRLRLLEKLPVHTGCVNTVSWNEAGDLLLSGSDDRHLCITSSLTQKVVASVRTIHRGNIFSARFLPNSSDRRVVSCSGNGLVAYTEVERWNDNSFRDCFCCHTGTAYKVVTIPNDGNVFLSCGEDGTVRSFDLRIKTHCSVECCTEDTLIDCRHPVTAIAVDPVAPYYLAVGCADSYVRIYDRRMLGMREAGDDYRGRSGLVNKFSAQELEGQSHRITSLVYSANGKDMLVSYASENLYLFHVEGRENGLSTSTERADGTYRRPVMDSSVKPKKKLRLRGDWSDTGPKARPERECTRDLGQRRPSDRISLMRHMSDVLNRVMNNPVRNSSATDLADRLVGLSSAQQAVGSSGGESNISEDRTVDLERSIAESSMELTEETSTEGSGVREDHTTTRSPQFTTEQGNSVPGSALHSDDEALEASNSKTHLASVADHDSMDDEISETDELEIEDKPVLSLPHPSILQKYVGHRNSRTMIKEANFWGDNFVMSGSDCGHVFIWERCTAELVMIVEADGHVVNCIQPHPFDPILATSGIDYDIKLWAPLSEQADFDQGYASEIVGRNIVMEAEARDTVTVPASFMIRMLASVNHLRQGGMLARWRQRAQRNNSNSNPSASV